MIKILVIVEDKADFYIASGLADRVFLEKGEDWITDSLDSFREWTGLEQNNEYSRWQDINKIRKQYNFRYLGHHKLSEVSGTTNKAPGLDGAKARLIVQMALIKQQTEPELKAIILLKDQDRNPKQYPVRQCLEYVQKSFSQVIIIIGIPDPKRESWILNGFEPENQKERDSLQEITEKLHFNPCEEPERLRTSERGREQTKIRDIKYVLDYLTTSQYHREKKCWEETPLHLLMQRGQRTGLSCYLDEIEKRLLPLLGE
jgi:hypothetical protein